MPSSASLSQTSASLPLFAALLIAITTLSGCAATNTTHPSHTASHPTNASPRASLTLVSQKHGEPPHILTIQSNGPHASVRSEGTLYDGSSVVRTAKLSDTQLNALLSELTRACRSSQSNRPSGIYTITAEIDGCRGVIAASDRDPHDCFTTLSAYPAVQRAIDDTMNYPVYHWANSFVSHPSMRASRAENDQTTNATPRGSDTPVSQSTATANRRHLIVRLEHDTGVRAVLDIEVMRESPLTLRMHRQGVNSNELTYRVLEGVDAADLWREVDAAFAASEPDNEPARYRVVLFTERGGRILTSSNFNAYCKDRLHEYPNLLKLIEFSVPSGKSWPREFVVSPTELARFGIPLDDQELDRLVEECKKKGW